MSATVAMPADATLTLATCNDGCFGVVPVQVPGIAQPVFVRPDDVVYYYEVLLAAARVGKVDQLIAELQHLAQFGMSLEEMQQTDRPLRHQCLLSRDFAPLSFGFCIYRYRAETGFNPGLSGGLLYHGSHDGFGSGDFPTLAVTLTPADGWRIHT